MYFVEGIPSHILQNIESIKANIRSIISNVNVDQDFSSLLNSAINNINSTFSSSGLGFSTDIKTIVNPYSNAPGIYSNIGIQTNNPILNKMLGINSENNIKNAYDTLLKQNLQEIVPHIATANKKEIIDKIKGLEKNTSLITDEEFFDAETLTPEQITDILRKKGSPYADMKFEGGKSVGQLIYEECHKAGNINKGPRTINPAMILAIMGAESNFGKNAKNLVNPFNVKVNGNFYDVKSFEQSLNIAVNTMYNWALDRPKDSKVSLFDYAGDKYCENYSLTWKPSVERYFLEFSINESFISKNKENLKSINDIILNNNNFNSILNNSIISNENPISNLGLLSSIKNLGNIGNTENQDE